MCSPEGKLPPVLHRSYILPTVVNNAKTTTGLYGDKLPHSAISTNGTRGASCKYNIEAHVILLLFVMKSPFDQQTLTHEYCVVEGEFSIATQSGVGGLTGASRSSKESSRHLIPTL